MIVRNCKIAELEATPNLRAVLDEYAQCAVPELGEANPQYEAYRVMERTGRFQAIGAFDGAMLAGFAFVVTAVSPHYGKLVATAESMFVPKEYRHSGVGLYLMRAVKEHAWLAGAHALVYTAAVDSPLSKLLDRRRNARKSHDVFIERI
jgi:GNAT superfamily N-acetyltransferase